MTTKSDINKAFGAFCALEDSMRARHAREAASLSQTHADILSLRRRCVLKGDPIPDDATETIARVNALVEEEKNR